ncbi:vesicle-associated membrane protein 8-like [Mytilus galloprovincialis]|uniref:V-SNARE coiled-coil homology domain-containing protein n=1 Tax=Mytilus galloprovincialis TaxID=29158 RepID=A0A8B6BUW6_MYTGA|nr:Hypothetical predicted protein [Mytilus galloprovincialis]
MSSHNTDHIDRLQGDVNEVTHLLKDNVEKVLERGEKIEDLQNRSEDLTASSIQFKSRSRDLRRKMCCKNFKMTCILIIVITVVIAIIILVILFTVKPWDKDSGSGHHKNETYIMST